MTGIQSKYVITVQIKKEWGQRNHINGISNCSILQHDSNLRDRMYDRIIIRLCFYNAQVPIALDSE